MPPLQTLAGFAVTPEWVTHLGVTMLIVWGFEFCLFPLTLHS